MSRLHPSQMRNFYEEDGHPSAAEIAAGYCDNPKKDRTPRGRLGATHPGPLRTLVRFTILPDGRERGEFFS